MSELISREEFLASNDITIERVDLPGGKHAYVKGLSALERDRWEESNLVKKGRRREANLANARARLVQRTACDEDGKLIFRPGDVEKLGEKSAAVIDILFQKALELSGVSDEDLEELVKNSGNGQSDDFNID